MLKNTVQGKNIMLIKKKKSKLEAVSKQLSEIQQNCNINLTDCVF